MIQRSRGGRGLIQPEEARSTRRARFVALIVLLMATPATGMAAATLPENIPDFSQDASRPRLPLVGPRQQRPVRAEA